jgi:trans-aconitate methyltransferase
MIAPRREPATATDWSAEAYARTAGHHRRYDREFIEDLQPARDAHILDLGCGIGDFTEQLAALVPSGRVVGIDSSPSMIERAERRARPGLEFRHGQVERLDEIDLGGRFDLIVSRACLHWVPAIHQPDVLTGVARALSPGGRFRASFGGAGNIPRTLSRMLTVAASEPYRSHLPEPFEPWYFATPGHYFDLLLDSPFAGSEMRVWSVAQLRDLGDEASFRSWFRAQVALSVIRLLPEDLHARYENEVLSRLLPRCHLDDGSYAEIYVRINVDARLSAR